MLAIFNAFLESDIFILRNLFMFLPTSFIFLILATTFWLSLKTITAKLLVLGTVGIFSTAVLYFNYINDKKYSKKEKKKPFEIQDVEFKNNIKVEDNEKNSLVLTKLFNKNK